MNYIEFRNKVQGWPLIFINDVLSFGKNEQVIRNQIDRWQKKKLLIKLRRGVFLLNSNDRKINPSRIYVANQLYGPSYASMEYTLNYYGLIPEKVNYLTSITTKKTLRVDNELGNFIYQHIKIPAFRGYKAIKDEAGLTFFIAEAEKAIVDFFYLNLAKFKKLDERIFEDSYRLQNLEILSTKKVLEFAGYFKDKKLMDVCKLFCEFIKKRVR